MRKLGTWVNAIRMAIALISTNIAVSAHAVQLSLDVEAVLIEDVGATWTEVPLANTYSNPVAACTYNLPVKTNPSATVRMRPGIGNPLDIRIQQFESSDTVTAGDVHCLIVDEGQHTLPSGLKIEAYKVTSDATSGLAIGWGVTTIEDVTLTLQHTYTKMVVLGQVMTFNDAKASVFWTNNCTNRNVEPNPASFCVGKHIGQINGSRLDETLGYIVIDAKSGSDNDVHYAFDRGSDSVAGVGNSPAYVYGSSIVGARDYDIGVATQAAEDGGQGGWAVLYGNDPLPNSALHLAIEEEVVAGDSSRTHTNEQVYFGVFDNQQSADITASKDVEVFDASPSEYALPSSELIYKISVSNAGSAAVDEDTIFFIDKLPNEVEYFNGDMDGGAGPATGPVYFTHSDSGLTFDAATDLKYAAPGTPPATFADCTLTGLTAGYNANVGYICYNPKGTFKSGSLGPDPSFSVSFRVRVK